MTSFPIDNVEGYLSGRFGGRVELLEISRFGRGSSRQTWFARLIFNGEEKKLSFRLDYPSGSIQTSPLEMEYFLYDRLGQANIPIAKALWWEGDALVTSRPFYVREHVEGSWDIPNYTNPAAEFDDLRIAISKEHLSKLALVHRVSWRELELHKVLKAPAGIHDCAIQFVDNVMDRYYETAAEPVPIVLAAADWLKARAPVAPCISLCKGTNGLGEEVFNEGKLVALSDWEEASLGDPAADFAYLQSFLPEIERDGANIWGLQKGLDYYQTVSGIHIELSSVRYYGDVRALTSTILALKAGSTVCKNPKMGELRAAWTAVEVGNLGKRLLAAAMGWAPSPDHRVFAEIHESVGQL